MKKTYISPKFMLVELRCNKMLAQSLIMASGSGYQVDNATDVLVKENSSSVNDVNVWDNEW